MHRVPHLHPFAGQSLMVAVEQAGMLRAVRKIDLNTGDTVVIKTTNSVYTLRTVGGGLYAVSGGWFDRKGLTPMTLSVNGCTWGGSMIKVDIVAACGLCLEFGNRVRTSPIRAIIHLRAAITN